MKTLVGMIALIVVVIGSGSVARTPSATPRMQSIEAMETQPEGVPAYIYSKLTIGADTFTFRKT